jgi:hypothetical protein
MHMALRTVLMSVFLSVCLTPVFAQSTPDQMVARFFDIYKTEGGSDSAVSYLFATNKYTLKLGPQLDTLKAKLRQYIDVFGQFHGYDLLTKKSAGPNYILFVYLVRHDREPLTFRMLFYKAADKWKIQTFNFNDNMDDELQDASKAASFKENN